MDNKSIHFNDFKTLFNILLILLPIFLITGPLLPDLTVSILAIFSLFYIRNKKFFNNYFFVFFIIFWFLTLASSFFAEDKFLSFKNSLFYFRFLLFSLFVWWYLEIDKKILKKIYFVLLFCFLAIIFDSIYQYFNGVNIFNMELVTKNRVSSFFGDELKMGSFLMRLFPFLIALTFLFYKKEKHKKFLTLFIIFIVLIQVTIFLSGERTSFILFNFTIILFLIFLNDLKKTRLFIFIISIISIAFLFTTESPFKKRIINYSFKQIEITENGLPKYIFSQQYHEHYLSSWKMFNDYKYLGIGTNNFRVKCKDKDYNFSKFTCSNHPHNFPLQLLAETGILSFLIYLMLNIIVWYSLIKNLFTKILYKKKILTNFQISLLINITILFWPLSPNGNFFNNWISIMIFYPFGFLLWSMRNSKKMYLKPIKKKHFLSKFYFTNKH